MKAIEQGKKYKLVDKKGILKAGYVAVIEDFGEDTYKRLVKAFKADPEFQLSDEIRAYITSATAEQVKYVDNTTKEQIQQRVLMAQQQGLSIQATAKLIDDLYLEQIIPNRSKVIAITEVNSSSNYGSFQGAKRAVKDYDLKINKIWIATQDSRVRPTHAVAGGHDPIPLNERFTVGNSKMLYPGDYAGGGEEVIRCRCALGYVSAE